MKEIGDVRRKARLDDLIDVLDTRKYLLWKERLDVPIHSNLQVIIYFVKPIFVSSPSSLTVLMG